MKSTSHLKTSLIYAVKHAYKCLTLFALLVIIVSGCGDMSPPEYIEWQTNIKIPEDSEFVGAEVKNVIVDAPAFYKVMFTNRGLEKFLRSVQQLPRPKEGEIRIQVNEHAPKWWRHEIVMESYEILTVDSPTFYMRVDVERFKDAAMVYLAIFPY